MAVVAKARTACEVSNHAVANHFVDINKMVDLGSGSQRAVDDLMLTRYACYLVAQNGDPKKPEIAFAQTYFAVQTRRARHSAAKRPMPQKRPPPKQIGPGTSTGRPYSSRQCIFTCTRG